MAAAQPAPHHLEYRICSYVQSNPQETPAWFSLQLRLHGKTFSINVSDSRFQDSPNRMLEFQNYLAYLASDGDTFVDEESDFRHVTASNDVHSDKGITIDDCFAWAVQPFINSFKMLAPKPSPASRITLQDFFSSESYECQLGASDDCLKPGSIDLLDAHSSFMPEECYIDPIHKHSPSASVLFPTFPLSQIGILSDDPCHIFNDEPDLVLVHGEEYFFKSFEHVGEDLGMREIRKYEQIANARFGPEVRTSRLFGIAQDDQSRILGILLHRIHEDTTLEDAVGDPATQENTRMRWKEQITQSLEALHDAGVIWGDAKADNVLVDVQGDAWIIDFGGGYTEGWVDKGNSGTIAGDNQGLKNIIKLLDIEKR